MTGQPPRNKDEQQLYEGILLEVQREGVIPEYNWEMVAEKRFRLEMLGRMRHENERPLREAIRLHGIEVDSVLDLMIDDEMKHDHLVPLLIQHFDGDYEGVIMDGIVRALGASAGDKTAIIKAFLTKFGSIKGSTFPKSTIGAVLGEIATKADTEVLLGFLLDDSHGGSRMGIVDAITRLMKEEAVPVLIPLLKDETIFNFVIENLGRLKAKEAVPYLEPFLKHEEGYTRQEAKKAIKKCSRVTTKKSPLPPPSGIDSLAAGQIYEVSVGFDLDDLAPYLRKISRALKLKLPVAALVDFAESLETGEEQGVSLEVPYDSGKIGLHYRIIKDDSDACELFLLTPSKSLAESLDQHLEGFV